MSPYPIVCGRPGCGRPATHKIAARWSDGFTSELKTYALTCLDCLPEFFRQAKKHRAAYRFVPGETLDEPGIWLMVRGARDRALPRLVNLEEQTLSTIRE